MPPRILQRAQATADDKARAQQATDQHAQSMASRQRSRVRADMLHHGDDGDLLECHHMPEDGDGDGDKDRPA